MAKIIHRDWRRSYSTLLDLAVELNFSFYRMAKEGAMVYRADHTRREVTYAIGQVRKEKTRRKKIKRIAQHFPHDWPLHEQGAYLLRAFSGLQIFPDANHRTGLAIMREHLHDHWRHFEFQGVRLAAFVENLRSLKSPYCTRCNAGELKNRDMAFDYIASVVRDNCRRLTVGEAAARIVSRLPGLQGIQGTPPVITTYAPEDADTEHHRKAI